MNIPAVKWNPFTCLEHEAAELSTSSQALVLSDPLLERPLVNMNLNPYTVDFFPELRIFVVEYLSQGGG